jgi:hypothetical protein
MKAYLGNELVFDTSASCDKYIRPSDWIPLPDVVDGEDKFVGLFHVRDDGAMDRIAIRFAGKYTVDWGDGVVENYNANQSAEHQYDFGSLPNENLTKEGYKQVIIIVVPQAGERLTSITLNMSLSNGARNNSFSDAKFSADTLTTLYNAIRGQFLLKNFEFVGSSLEDAGLAFSFCVQLERIKISDVSKITHAASFLNGTLNLKEAVFGGDFASLVNASNMFSSSNLQEIDISLPVATNLYQFASGCTRLRKITFRELNQNPINMSYAFGLAGHLEEIEYGETINLTGSCQQTFLSSYNLKKVPTLNLDNVDDSWRMFEGSQNLVEIDLVNIKASISLRHTGLSKNTLVNIFNNLIDMGEEREIDIRGCFGAGELTDTDVAIATNKNWTVIK